MTDQADNTGTADTGSADQTRTTTQTDAGAGAADKGAGKAADKAADKGAAKDAGAGGGDGAGKAADEPFYASFTDPKLKDSPVVLRHKTVEDVARSLVAAESKLGVPADQLLRLPTKPEEHAELYRKLGAPETADGYEIGLPEKATDDDKAVAKRFAEHMFNAGPFPPAFVKAAVEWNNAETERADAELKAAQEARRAEGETWLKQELGQTYDPDMKTVGNLLAKYGPEGLAEELDLTSVGDNPRLIRMLHTFAEKLGESQSLHGASDASGKAGITPGQAKAARLNLEADPVKGPALRDASHSMHKQVVEERNKLLEAENAKG